MRILVTGHSGYIGTIMVPMLRAEGYDLRGLDSDLFRRCTFGRTPPSIPSLCKDIRDVERCDLEGYDAVIHLAGLSNDPLGDLNPELTYDINCYGTVRLAEVAKQAGVERFVFSSSCSTYGAAGDDMIDENAGFRPVTPYGRSKVLAEEGLAPLADSTFSPVYLRNATAFGASPRLRFDLVLNNLTAWAYSTGRILLKSDGSPWRPIIHIRDISQAFIAVLQAPRDLVHNQAFNVSLDQENYRIRDLAEIVSDVIPNCRVEYAANAGPDKRCYRVSGAKIKRVLGYRGAWTARAGAIELHESLVANGVTVEEFEGPRYRRVDHLKELLRTGTIDDRLRWMDEERRESYAGASAN